MTFSFLVGQLRVGNVQTWCRHVRNTEKSRNQTHAQKWVGKAKNYSAEGCALSGNQESKHIRAGSPPAFIPTQRSLWPRLEELGLQSAGLANFKIGANKGKGYS